MDIYIHQNEIKIIFTLRNAFFFSGFFIYVFPRFDKFRLGALCLYAPHFVRHIKRFKLLLCQVQIAIFFLEKFTVEHGQSPTIKLPLFFLSESCNLSLILCTCFSIVLILLKVLCLSSLFFPFSFVFQVVNLSKNCALAFSFFLFFLFSLSFYLKKFER